MCMERWFQQGQPTTKEPIDHLIRDNPTASSIISTLNPNRWNSLPFPVILCLLHHLRTLTPQPLLPVLFASNNQSKQMTYTLSHYYTFGKFINSNHLFLSRRSSSVMCTASLYIPTCTNVTLLEANPIFGTLHYLEQTGIYWKKQWTLRKKAEEKNIQLVATRSWGCKTKSISGLQACLWNQRNISWKHINRWCHSGFTFHLLLMNPIFFF